MYGYSGVGKGFGLIRFLGGLSKTLNVASRVIPIYTKAKPMLTNTKAIINTFKNINLVDKKTIKKESIKDSSNINNPKFFI